ncbi:MAG: rRNA maturation RNase YbeY [Hyphomicrobiales bacterium]|nr:rRNA maturation RNase YbeY [Hyphomicrobiales bacterium]
MALIALDIIRDAGDWPPAGTLAALAETAIAAAIEVADLPTRAGEEVAIVLTDDAHIRALNREFRSKDAATDVLSFPRPPATGGHDPLIGEIVLAEETVTRDAAEAGKALNDHFTHLVVHGFLHLFGYDHISAPEARIMERLETRILARLGIADPYGEAGSN